MECFAGMAGAAPTAAAATGALGLGTFNYNRENFLYDRERRLHKEIAVCRFRIEQASLWRQDVRDLISLTEYKMHMYLFVNALMLGFTVILWTEGRLPENTPDWLMIGFGIATSGAFIFLLLSIWLAMHAAVAAQSYEARILTQLVRLPMPTWNELEACRTYGSEFERTEPRQMFRAPFVMGRQENLVPSGQQGSAPAGPPQQAATGAAMPVPEANPQDDANGEDSASGDEDQHPDQRSVPPAAADPAPAAPISADPWGLERRGDDIPELGTPTVNQIANLRHIKLARQAACYWQTADAFARISMSIGVNQLLLGVCYYVQGYILVQVGSVSAATYAVIILIVLSECILKLDLSLGSFEVRLMQVLLATGPTLCLVAGWCWAKVTDFDQTTAEALVAGAFVMHGTFLGVLARLCKVREQDNGALLPIAFRSVLYLDVFGRDAKVDQGAQSRTPGSFPGETEGLSAQVISEPDEELGTTGPALNAVRYEDGRPVPLRPEDLKQRGAVQDVRFLPGVPQVKESCRLHRAEDEDYWNPNNFMPGDDFNPSTEDDLYPREVTPPWRDERGLTDMGEEMFPVTTGHGAERTPGLLPWRAFTFAMSVLSVVWFVAGGMAVAEALDLLNGEGEYSHVEVKGRMPWVWNPEAKQNLVRDIWKVPGTGRSDQRREQAQHSRSHHSSRSLLQRAENVVPKPSQLDLWLHGLFGYDMTDSAELVQVEWPYSHMEPHSLACDASGQYLLAMDHFNFYFADLGASSSSGSSLSATFAEAPCSALSGEGLQDVSLSCSQASSHCQALVLHRQGKRITSCSLPKTSADVSDALPKDNARAAQLSTSWLEVAHHVQGGVHLKQEKPVALSLPPTCDGSQADCSFVGTTRGRVVQLKNSTAGSQLVPKSIALDEEEVMLDSGLARHFNDRYLGVLEPKRQTIQVVDIEKGGVPAGNWMLRAGRPMEAFCAGGGYVYFLGKGPKPEIWRIQAPEALQPSDLKK